MNKISTNRQKMENNRDKIQKKCKNGGKNRKMWEKRKNGKGAIKNGKFNNWGDAREEGNC